MNIHRRSENAHRRLQSKKSGEEYSFSASLTDALQSKDFFIHHEILPSGCRSSAPHFHRETEELVYVLRGSPTAVEGEVKIQLNTGDSVSFAAESERLHYL